MTINRTQLAAELGKTVRQLETLMSKGLPIVSMADKQAGIPYEFDLEECREWVEDYDERINTDAELKREIQDIATEENEDIVKARIAKLEVETARLQIRLEKEQGELVPIDGIAAIVDKQFSSVKAHLLSLPAKLSPMLINISERKEIDDLMTSYIREALEELVTEDVYAGDTDERSEDLRS